MPLGKSQLDIENDIANWGYDDLWRITWMTIMFCFLMPLSRSAWALKANFSLAMWLHIVSGLYTRRADPAVEEATYCCRTVHRSIYPTTTKRGR